jgi:subtilisin family serine protease
VFGPRLPAAIEGVLGVSAVRDGLGAHASYSNADDLRDPDDGIGAFGGDRGDGVPPPAGEEHLRPGIVGLFVSDEVPPNEPNTPNDKNPANTHGWAEWDGTSFAAPVVTGLAACMWAVRPQLSPTQVIDHIVQDANGYERPYLNLRQRY